MTKYTIIHGHYQDTLEFAKQYIRENGFPRVAIMTDPPHGTGACGEETHPVLYAAWLHAALQSMYETLSPDGVLIVGQNSTKWPIHGPVFSQLFKNYHITIHTHSVPALRPKEGDTLHWYDPYYIIPKAKCKGLIETDQIHTNGTFCKASDTYANWDEPWNTFTASLSLAHFHLIIDPFVGSDAKTAIAAYKHNIPFIGGDISEEATNIAVQTMLKLPAL